MTKKQGVARVKGHVFRNGETARLRRVTGPAIWVRCQGCGGRALAGDGHGTVADLDGKPFEAYYHAGCKPGPRLMA